MQRGGHDRMNQPATQQAGTYPRPGATSDIWFLLLLAFLCFGRLLFLHDINYDDNCWLLSIYGTTDLSSFLDTGFRELRRVPQGISLYTLLLPHTLVENSFHLWQSLTILTGFLSSLGIYLLLRSLPGIPSTAPFWAAVFFLIAPIETTQGIVHTSMYRVGTMLSIFSLYLTSRYMQTLKRWYFAGALVLYAFVSVFLLEGAIALEPGRFAILAYLFAASGCSRRESAKRGALLMLPFVLVTIPIVLYKLLLKPFGIYAGTYQTSLWFIAEPSMWYRFIKHFLFDNWIFLAKYMSGFPAWGLALGILGGIAAWNRASPPPPSGRPLDGPGGSSINLPYFTAVLGLILLLFPALMYMYAGRVPTYGFDSRHGIIMQPGNAVLLAGAFAWLYARYGKAIIFRTAAAVFIAMGVFFCNVNIDQYVKTLSNKQQFWRAFAKKFPTLPAKADFVFDVLNPELLYRYYADYDFELPLNLLYSRTSERGKVRSYRAIPASEFSPSTERFFTRLSHYGNDVFDTKNIIPVSFRDGRLYVGKETAGLPGISYSVLANNPVPKASSAPAAGYPLRNRLNYLPRD